jgi:hypothetical protein
MLIQTLLTVDTESLQLPVSLIWRVFDFPYCIRPFGKQSVLFVDTRETATSFFNTVRYR